MRKAGTAKRLSLRTAGSSQHVGNKLQPHQAVGLGTEPERGHAVHGSQQQASGIQHSDERPKIGGHDGSPHCEHVMEGVSGR